MAEPVPADRRLWTPAHRRVVRTATCVHEAGHAVVCLYYGVELDKIRITDDESGFVTSREDRLPYADALCFAAGLAAEQIWLARTDHPELADAALIGAGHDTAALTALCHRHGLVRTVIRQQAHRLIGERWAEVMRLGEALLVTKTIRAARAGRVARTKPVPVPQAG